MEAENQDVVMLETIHVDGASTAILDFASPADLHVSNRFYTEECVTRNSTCFTSGCKLFSHHPTEACRTGLNSTGSMR